MTSLICFIIYLLLNCRNLHLGCHGDFGLWLSVLHWNLWNCSQCSQSDLGVFLDGVLLMLPFKIDDVKFINLNFMQCFNSRFLTYSHMICESILRVTSSSRTLNTCVPLRSINFLGPWDAMTRFSRALECRTPAFPLTFNSVYKRVKLK